MTGKPLSAHRNLGGVLPPHHASQQLIARLAQLYPTYGSGELCRLALLLTLHFPEQASSTQTLGGSHHSHGAGDGGDDRLEECCHQLIGRVRAAGDQHAALASEMDALAATAPCDFSPAHIWSLVRAIRVQGQMLDLYLGPPSAAGQPGESSSIQEQPGDMYVDNNS